MKCATPLVSVLILLHFVTAITGYAQDPDSIGESLDYQERYVDVDGVSLRYIDFGGEGVPLVFTPALFLPVEEYAEIGARLKDDIRVLVVGRRDEGGPVQWLGTRIHAQDLLGFLDGMEIDRAILAGNTDPAERMTYLAEEYPERLAGVIYLGGPPSAATNLLHERASGVPMLMRLWSDSDEFLEKEAYPFRYRTNSGFRFSVPALTFVNSNGVRGVEADPAPLVYVGSPLVADRVRAWERSTDPAGPFFARLSSDIDFRDDWVDGIENSEVKAYFKQLAADTELQAEMAAFYAEKVQPVEIENWVRFREAFADQLRVIEIDAPIITGYEYRNAPYLIEGHIRQFLEDVGAGAAID